MKVDRLDVVITIEKKTSPSGPYEQSTWQELAQVRCKWIDLNSIELSKAETTKGFCYAQLFLRKLTGLTATCRVVKDNEVWNIIGYPKKVDMFYEIKVQRAVAG